jgi:ParB/RepB/Spo0J family partition protein
MPVAMSNAVLVPVEKLRPGPYQMRRDFDETSLQELAEDIGERGILEPLVVRPDPSNLAGANYMIIAGERRYRAAKLAGLATVPVIIRQMDEHEAEMAALAENLQRQDLNPLEEQQLFQSLQGQYNWSISEIARRIHKSRHYVQKRLYGTLASFDTNSETQTTEVMAVAINQAELADHAEIAEVSENEMLLAVYPLSDEQNSNRTLSGQEAQGELDETLPTTNTNNSAVSRLPAMSSFVRFGRAVDRIINAVELLGLSDEAIRQEWLAHLDLLTTKLNQLKVCLDD